MGTKTRKALNFDFNTILIQENMSTLQIQSTYRKAYYDIEKYLLANGFEHVQESAYTSVEPISFQEVEDIIENIIQEMPYLKDAIKSMEVTSVGKTYEVTEILKNEHKIEIVNDEELYKLDKNYGTKLSKNENKRRSIRFDLNGDLLEEVFERENIDCDTTIAYKWIEKYFEELGYSHEQGSVYMTPDKKTNAQIMEDLLKFSHDLPHVAECFDSVQVTNVGRKYNVTSIANGQTEYNEKDTNLYQQNEMSIDKDNNVTYEY